MKLACRYLDLLYPAQPTPGCQLPEYDLASFLLVQLVLRRPILKSGPFSMGRVDGHVIFTVGGTPMACLPVIEWQRRLLAFVEPLRSDLRAAVQTADAVAGSAQDEGWVVISLTAEQLPPSGAPALPEPSCTHEGPYR